MAEALSHLRVVELADGVQAASCGKQFAAWGAHVTVVEPEGGHPLRSASPLATGPGGESVSLLWEYLGARKSKGHRAEGEGRQGWLGELIAGADVLITDWKAARLEDEGLGPDALASLNTGLVAVRMSPFGSTGPYAGFEGTDLIVQALSGFCSFNGLPGREPLKAPANIGAFVCGVSAFVGALAALHERRSSGRGQTVECAYVEAIASIVPYLRTEYFGTPFGRTGTTGTGNDTYRTADGWVYFSVAAERAWESFLIGMDIDPETVPEGLRTPDGRSAGNAGLRAFVAGAVSSRSAIDVFLALNTLRIVTGILFTPEDLLENPHLQERGFLHYFDHPQLGRLVFPGAPGRLYTTPMAPPDSPTNIPDSNSQSPSSLPFPTSNQGPSDAPAQIPTSKFQFPSPAPPLHGLRILDLTAAWIGTYATLLLADLGAGVIKVESPARPDVWRGGEALRRPVPPSARPEAHRWNVNVNFNSVNRNKYDLTLDLDTEKGKALFLRLAGRADLVMENYTPRVMGNFGLGYEDLRGVNADVIMVSFSGFGATGPYSDFRAIGASTEMQAGWDCLLGYPGHDEPLMLGAMFADAISGLHMAAMALVALEHRQETGEGQRAEGGMFEASVSYIGEELLRASAGVGGSEPRANRHPDMAPHGAFPCAGDDRWLAIACPDDTTWRALLSVAGPGLDRPEWSTAAGRLAAADALDAAVGAWTLGHDPHALMLRLQAAGVPAGEVLNTAQVLEDQHFAAREWFIPMTHPDLGTHRYNGFPWRFSRTPPVATTPPPRLGEHAREVLRTELGLTPPEIEALFAEGVSGEVFEKAADQN